MEGEVRQARGNYTARIAREEEEVEDSAIDAYRVGTKQAKRQPGAFNPRM